MPIEPTPSRTYDQIARAMRYVVAHAQRQPSLDELAAEVGLSPFHLQRLFSEWAGLSPKRFLQVLTKEHVRQRLQAGDDLLTVADAAGLSSPSRVHDLMVSCEAMTPGEVQAAGRGLTVGFGWGDTPFGAALLAWTPRGLCHLVFALDDPQAQEEELRARWQGATLQRDDAEAAARLAQVFPEVPTPGRLHLVLRGTNFQVRVWEALLRTDLGQVLSYSELAQRIGSPRAQRAVGSALAANSIGYLIPCHRVIRESGVVGPFRWGSERKLAMLGWEAGRINPE